jgi:hypothetical protein
MYMKPWQDLLLFQSTTLFCVKLYLLKVTYLLQLRCIILFLIKYFRKVFLSFLSLLSTGIDKLQL